MTPIRASFLQLEALHVREPRAILADEQAPDGVGARVAVGGSDGRLPAPLGRRRAAAVEIKFCGLCI